MRTKDREAQELDVVAGLELLHTQAPEAHARCMRLLARLVAKSRLDRAAKANQPAHERGVQVRRVSRDGAAKRQDKQVRHHARGHRPARGKVAS